MNAIQGNVLVVEDELINSRVMTTHLEDAGHTVTAVDNGEDALEQVERQTFDAILLDIMMPGIGGFEVLTQIRQSYSLSELPVILVTALTQPEAVIQGMNLGANDYLTKPIDSEIMLARLQTQLSLKHTETQKTKAENALKNQVTQQDALLRINQAVQEMTRPSDLINVLNVCLRESTNMGLNAQSMAVHTVIDLENEIIETFRVGPTAIPSDPQRKRSRHEIKNWQTNRVAIEPDIEKSRSRERAQGLRNRFGGLQIRSLINVPFSKGMMSAHSIQPNAFQHSDAEALKQIAEILSVGLSRLSDLEYLADREIQL